MTTSETFAVDHFIIFTSIHLGGNLGDRPHPFPVFVPRTWPEFFLEPQFLLETGAAAVTQNEQRTPPPSSSVLAAIFANNFHGLPPPAGCPTTGRAAVTGCN